MTHDLRNWAEATLREEAARFGDSPIVNSVFHLAHAFLKQIEAGETGTKALLDLAQTVHVDELTARADRFRVQHTALAQDDRWKSVRDRLDALADQGFEAFADAVRKNTGGIVFTAHPTFAMSAPLRKAVAAYVTHPDATNRDALSACIAEGAALDAEPITLEREHDEVQAVLRNAQDALLRFTAELVSVARARFPDQWRSLSPGVFTLASWVGYDLDGRTDIHWSRSLSFRLGEKAAQLHRYADWLDDVAKQGPEALAKLATRCREAASRTAQEFALFAVDLTEPDALVAAANAQTAAGADAVTDATEIVDALSAVINDPATNDDLASDLIAFRALVEVCQLGTGRIHLRLNAAQIRTVLARDLDLETEDAALGRLAFAALSRELETAEPRETNYGDLFLEQTTARRQFMLCAQILKHIDGGSPIRFLVAESENPATILGALYLARQYGVDHQLDLSPLFETPDAMERGGRFIERLLENENFRDYLRRRGRLCIQLGFSDSGRFIGQIAAEMAIERIHHLVGRALARSGLEDVALLIFNTHGESMGRGAYPGSFKARFDHLLTPHVRGQFAGWGVDAIHETSFQGGDGFLHFATPDIADATVAAFAEHVFEPVPVGGSNDPFYGRIDFTWDFYRGLGAWQRRLLENKQYHHVLLGFGPGFLLNAGSRKRKRPDAGASGPRSMRAISNNGVLQQLGIPANVACGIGSSVGAETERLVGLVNASERMRNLIFYAVQARGLTSLPALRGYALMLDPSYWIARTKTGTDVRHIRACETTAEMCTRLGFDQRLRRLAEHFAIDLSRFDRILADLDEAPDTADRHDRRLGLHVLHAVRQALIMRALMLVGRTPRMSARHGITLPELVEDIALLKFDEVIEALERIFPQGGHAEAAFQALTEPGAGQTVQDRGYRSVHAEVIGPLKEIRDGLRQIALAITHAYGAYG